MRAQILYPYFTEIKFIKGVGPALSKYLGKLIGGDKIKDIIFHRPHAVLDRSARPEIFNAEEGQIASFEVEVEKHQAGYGKSPYKILCRNDSGFLNILYFGGRKEYLEKLYPIGEKVIVSGQIELFGETRQINHPDFVVKPEDANKIPKYEPIYPLTAGITQKKLLDIISQSLAKVKPLPEWQEINVKLSFDEAIRKLHYPDEAALNMEAVRRLAYDEFLASQMAQALVYKRATKSKACIIKPVILTSPSPSYEEGDNKSPPPHRRGNSDTPPPHRRGMGGGYRNFTNLRSYNPKLTANAKTLRINQTEVEKKLWHAIRAKQIENHKFRRQEPIDNYIVDFVCLEKKLIIELDGGQHLENDEDLKRDAQLNSKGFEILRFWNHDVIEQFDAVLEEIRTRLTSPSPSYKEGDAKALSPHREGGSESHHTLELPFTLTNGQIQALEEISNDMQSGDRMFRLVQGDVGSGKTAVALAAMFAAAKSGKQSIFMVPTTLLAYQQKTWITEVTEKHGVVTEVLTGNEKGKKREEILARFKAGEIDILVGTHALFQDWVEPKDLGLVVIDEQHRFGVLQRLKLTQKNEQAHILLMTATPIPRTLTIAYYGEMDISRITDKPAERKQVETLVMPISKLDEITKSLARSIQKGEKIYWICPLVEESEKSDLAAATDRYNQFKKMFGDKVALVHGKMKNDEKQQVLLDFKTGKYNLLIATTVIEVGIDVRDATIIFIEHAERFGLSQLHQLRGRVGRGDKQSTCLLLYANKLGADSVARLKIMKENHDGFKIAEEDLKLRGGGEVLGTRQSGMPSFHFAEPVEHFDLLEGARQEAKKIINQDPQLKSERGQNLRLLLSLFEYDETIEYISAG